MDYLSIYLVFLFHLSNFCSSRHIDILYILLDLYLSNLLDANLSEIVVFLSFLNILKPADNIKNATHACTP